MRFTTNAKQLSETLVNMNRVINAKNVLPILADIVFTVKDDNLTLKASDSEVTMQTTIALTDYEGEGSFPARQPTDILNGEGGGQGGENRLLLWYVHTACR